MLLVNVLVMATISLIIFFVLPLFFHGQLPGGLGGLALMCFVWGMAGAFISLQLSRFMAKMFMGVRVIDPNTNDPGARALVDTVHRLARQAGLSHMPEVGIFESPDVNAFATGPSQARSLVAVSTGLLNHMDRSQAEGVIGHELTHIANGDMVTMTLLQGVVNAFAMFLARVLAWAITQGSRDNNRGGNYFVYWLVMELFQTVFMILGYLVICKFSRWREFRADAGGARVAGRQNMISALQRLKEIHEAGADQLGKGQPAFQALMISGKTSKAALLFATHPPLEERIDRLQHAMIS